MMDRIGSVAGKVWGYLAANGETTVSQLTKKIDEPRDVVQRAIGWLAREDKLVFEKTGAVEKVKLK
jgi:hypothetical protein